jgi:modulator of FtsH protease
MALSINLGRILQLPGISGRAAETIILLAAALIGALLALIPGQPAPRLGLMLMLLWLPTWGGPTTLQVRELARRQYLRFRYSFWRFVLYQFATLPLLLAGLSLQGHLAGGLAWFALAVILSIVVALLNAWVLLVEILR